MSDELKACPFCGHKARWCGEDNKDPSEDHSCLQISCDGCGLQWDNNSGIKNTGEWEESKAAILALFNTRPIEDAFTAENKRLSERVAELEAVPQQVHEDKAEDGDETDIGQCSCTHDDRWRCAKNSGSSELTCKCDCHNRI